MKTIIVETVCKSQISGMNSVRVIVFDVATEEEIRGCKSVQDIIEFDKSENPRSVAHKNAINRFFETFINGCDQSHEDYRFEELIFAGENGLRVHVDTDDENLFDTVQKMVKVFC